MKRNTPKPMTHRHGDVGIQPCDAPARKGRQRLNHLRLAEGEVTGHSHRVVTLDGKDAVKAAELILVGGETYLHAKEPVAVIHQEHHRIELDAGWHRIIQQREYSPEGDRQVRD